MSNDNEKFGFLSGINITITGDDVMKVLTALTPLLWVVVISLVALLFYKEFSLLEVKRLELQYFGPSESRYISVSVRQTPGPRLLALPKALAMHTLQVWSEAIAQTASSGSDRVPGDSLWRFQSGCTDWHWRLHRVGYC